MNKHFLDELFSSQLDLSMLISELISFCRKMFESIVTWDN